MNPVTVSTAVDDGRVAGLSAIVASLPRSLHSVDRHGEIVAISGSPGWVDRALAAASSGARAVVVRDPTLDDDPARLSGTGILVAVDLPWSHSPAVPRIAGLLRSFERERLLEVRSDVDDAASAAARLLALIDLVLRTAGEIDAFDRLDTATGHLAARGRATNGADLHLVVAVHPLATGAARMRCVGSAEAVEIELPDPGTARPADIRHADATGSTRVPTVWESGRRAVWRRTAAALAGDDGISGPGPDDLALLVRARDPLR